MEETQVNVARTFTRTQIAAAGALVVVIMLAVFARRNRGSQAAAPDSDPTQPATLYVPTSNETTYVYYNSNNTTNNPGAIGGGGTPGGKNSGPTTEIRVGNSIGKRINGIPTEPASGGWGKGDSIGVPKLFGVQGASLPKSLEIMPQDRQTEAAVRTVYAEAFGDQPDMGDLEYWEKEYRENGSKYPSMELFRSYVSNWASKR